MKTRLLRELGRALVMGDRDQLTNALDAAIEPHGPMWERVSDVVIDWVVDPIIEGREEVIAGIRDALDQVQS